MGSTTRSQSESTVVNPQQHASSGRWQYGIVFGLVLWILVLVGFQWLSDPVWWAIFMLATVMLPVSTFFDTTYVQKRTSWSPNSLIWTVAMLPWLINIPLAIAYLFKRRVAMRELHQETDESHHHASRHPSAREAVAARTQSSLGTLRSLPRETVRHYRSAVMALLAIGFVVIVAYLLGHYTHLSPGFVMIWVVILLFAWVIFRGSREDAG